MARLKFKTMVEAGSGCDDDVSSQLLCDYGFACGASYVDVKTLCVMVVSLVIGNLKQRSWQVGATTVGDFIFGGALRAPSLDFQGENLGQAFIGCT
jgi:hypothetical protein